MVVHKSSCLRPFLRTDKTTGGSVLTPCNKCPKCISRSIAGWVFRLLEEERGSISSHWITLTYATKHIPITKKGRRSLCKRDVQLFFKRLRKAHSTDELKCLHDNFPIKYLAVGEYGGQRNRPHYHIAVFNAKLELIDQAWNKGRIYYGKVEGASIGYTMKYMSKPGKVGFHSNDDRQKEFRLMSKGLGKRYIEDKRNHKWHTADLENRMFLTMKGGRKIAMPRYYKDKIYEEDIRQLVAALQMEKVREHNKQQSIKPDYWDNMERRSRSIHEAFETMYYEALKGRNKI